MAVQILSRRSPVSFDHRVPGFSSFTTAVPGKYLTL
jgi:hypothetical protein